MLHWQRKSVRNRLLLWLKLVLFSLVGHLTMLTMLFFVYRGSMSDMAFTVSAAQLNNAIDVVWVKEIPPRRKAPVRARVAPNKKRSNRQVKKAVAPKKTVKQAPKTELKRSAPKKNIPKKQPIKKPVVKKQPVKKTVEKKKVAVKKPEPAKKQEVIKKEKLKPEPVKKAAPVNSQVDATSNQELADDQELAFEISGGYKELEALQQFQELQQEISRCWQPPVGVAQTVSCQIKVAFNWEGKVSNMETVKPSGILMFDVSSRNAVCAMEAPKFVRGKVFTITFKP